MANRVLYFPTFPCLHYRYSRTLFQTTHTQTHTKTLNDVGANMFYFRFVSFKHSQILTVVNEQLHVERWLGFKWRFAFF